MTCECMTCDTSDTSVLLPLKVEVDVSKYHACRVKRRWMSQSTTPATQSATPATQSAATCRQVPRLPRKKPRRPRRHLRTKRAAGASPMPHVPRLPRKVEVDVSKYHACYVKRRWMHQSATPATQSAATATQSAAACPQVPRLPRKKPRRPRRHLRIKRATRAYVPRLPRKGEVDVSKYHACHAQRRWMSQRATPATPTAAVKLCEDDKWCQLKTSCVRSTSYVWPLVPRLLRAKCSYMSPSATPAAQKAAAPTATPENQACRRSQPDATRATPATQSGSRCVQVPRLPRETIVDVSKCHACHAKCSYCHAKCGYMSPSATPATQKAAAPMATPENQARRRSQPDAIRATPATQSGSRCVQAPRL